MGTKKYFLILLLSLSSYILADDFSLNITSTWYNFGKYKNPLESNTLTEFIIVKTPKVLYFKNIKFKWIGKPIKKLAASLYKKKREHDILAPITDNIVSDGVWNTKKQELSFMLEHEKMISVNNYYLILSYPINIEKKIKNGKFLPSQTCLLK